MTDFDFLEIKFLVEFEASEFRLSFLFNFFLFTFKCPVTLSTALKAIG